MVCKVEMEEQYACCFHSILRKIQYDKLTVNAPPMVLFHSDEFTPLGLDNSLFFKTSNELHMYSVTKLVTFSLILSSIFFT